MALLDFFDSYDRKARLIPAAVTFSPVLALVALRLPGTFDSQVFKIGSGLLAIAIVFLGASLVRHLGAANEPELWTSWGGPPSTRLIRWRDETLQSNVKTRIRLLLEYKFSISLLSKEAEGQNPEEADRRIQSAFFKVRSLLREAPCQLCEKHNAEYGFARNLLASRVLFLTFALICAAIGGVQNASWSVTPAVILEAGLAALWIPVGWIVLPQLAKHSADRYAESAWMEFISRASA